MYILVWFMRRDMWLWGHGECTVFEHCALKSSSLTRTRGEISLERQQFRSTPNSCNKCHQCRDGDHLLVVVIIVSARETLG